MSSAWRKYEIVERTPSVFETLMLNPATSFPIVDQLDLWSLTPPLSFSEFDTITDLIQIHHTPSSLLSSTRRVVRRVGLFDPYLLTLNDRVSALELGLDRLLRDEEEARMKKSDRKYTWTAEIKTPERERKYKWTAEIEGGEKKKKKNTKSSYKFTAEIKRKGEDPVDRKYTVEFVSGGEKKEEEEKKKDKHKKEKKEKTSARIVEIEEPLDHGALVLRQVFAKRVDKRKGKRKELSPLDAAALIQKSFRAYLIRRSQALRALRELAIAKSKLKEIRALFNNFTYRRRLTRDAEERQRFSEKIIVLLLTVDAIEGADLMVRSAKKSMVDELEAMLDVVDPQPQGGKSLSMRRRTFDMPDAAINKELAEGVAQVVRMLDQDATGSETFEACL